MDTVINDFDNLSREELLEIAMNHDNLFIRAEAAKRITDPGILARLAVNDDLGCVGLAALEKITDDKLLVDIAANGINKDVRMAAISRISTQDRLADIALGTDRKKEYTAAINRITEPELLRKTAVQTEDRYVRKVVEMRMRELDIEPKLDECADRLKKSVETALNSVNDQETLYELIMNHPDLTVRETALQMLTDQKLLARIAVGHWQIEINRLALDKLTDQEMLLYTAQNSNNRSIRDKAIDMLEPSTLVTLINSDPAEFGGVICLHRLCGEPQLWFSRFTDDTVKHICSLLLKSYDKRLSDALILGYRGANRSLVRDYADSRIEQLKAREGTYTETRLERYVSKHTDFYGDGEFTAPTHHDSVTRAPTYKYDTYTVDNSEEIADLRRKLELSEGS